jgi:hypothetical protein
MILPVLTVSLSRLGLSLGRGASGIGTILPEPKEKPWRLREFRIGDLDGNQLRVFCDFSWELRQEQA